MDRIFQWLWNRYGTRYSWALIALMYPIALVTYMVWSMTIVAFERSSHYGAAALFTAFAVAARTYMLFLSGRKGVRAVEHWAAGSKENPREVLTATYIYSRRTVGRGVRPIPCGRRCSWLASVLSPGLPGRGLSSTRSWVSRSEWARC